jgi:HAD superfamily hydrolase (TIGR01459 family)
MSLPPSGAPAPIPIVDTIAALADATVAWLVDIWGVMHNGVQPFAEACDACKRFRENGGLIVLVSNSPRPHEAVAAQLDRIGVPRTSWDVIVSSGDVARSLIAGYAGRAILHIGPERDLPIFAGMNVERVKLDQADVVVCTGLFDDERETPDDYARLLASCLARGLQMICANPDITVERGGRIIFCAGAVARAYEQLGGKVAYAGKPYLPIYERAFETLELLRRGSADRSRLLAIGDGVHTDIAGAAAANVRSVFVASGVYVARPLSGAALEGLFPPPGPRPVAAMTRLSW